jgi:hypothetical protein
MREIHSEFERCWQTKHNERADARYTSFYFHKNILENFYDFKKERLYPLSETKYSRYINRKHIRSVY